MSGIEKPIGEVANISGDQQTDARPGAKSPEKVQFWAAGRTRFPALAIPSENGSLQVSDMACTPVAFSPSRLLLATGGQSIIGAGSRNHFSGPDRPRARHVHRRPSSLWLPPLQLSTVLALGCAPRPEAQAAGSATAAPALPPSSLWLPPLQLLTVLASGCAPRPKAQAARDVSVWSVSVECAVSVSCIYLER